MLAFYLRLSKADEEEEGNSSIDSQRECLYQNLYQYGLCKETIVEYIDNGYSGKNFSRPGVLQLFQDIEQGKIHTIMVKDFSRFGRNYSEVSEYVEKKFPQIGIRFIAVNNRYDSKKQPDESVAIFQNIFDDYSSEENSKKIRQILFQLKQEGKYIAPTAPYGYQKDKTNPYHLLIDPEAAEVVRLIFQLRCEGKNGAEIARYLNKREILSPSDYKNKKKGKHIWQSEVIWQIVRNREYLGNLVARKYDTMITGSRKRRLLPASEWIEIEAVHKAIVDKRTFELAQIAKGQKNIQKEKKAEQRNYLKGLVRCGGCGHKMKRKGQQKPFFFCKYYYYNPNTVCLKTGISEEYLLRIIWQILKQMEGVEKEYIYQRYREELQKKQIGLEKNKQKLKKRQKVERYLLYEKWKNGIISKEEYGRKKHLYDKECQREFSSFLINKTIIQKVETEEYDIFYKERNEYYKIFMGLLQEIVNEIFVNAEKQIQIQFCFLRNK